MLTIFKHECLIMLRQSQEWLYPISFFIIVICLFPLAFSPDPAFMTRYLPGCIWIAALFANLLTLQNIFATDIEDGHLEQCVLSKTPLALLLFAKIAATWLIATAPFVLLAPLLGYLFGLSLPVSLVLALSLLLGTPMITLIGSLGVALTFGLRQKGMLIGLLILPLITPILIFAVSVVTQMQSGFSVAGPLAFLSGCCLISLLIFPWIIAATVRIGLDD